MRVVGEALAGPAQRGERVTRRLETHCLDVREVEQQRSLLGCGGVRDMILERASDELPTPCVLVEPGDERAGSRVSGVHRQHVRCGGEGDRGVDRGDDGGGACLQGEVFGLAARGSCLSEEGAVERAIVADTRRVAAEALNGPHALGLDGEDLLISRRGACEVADGLFGEQCDPLEVRHLVHGVLRHVCGVRVELEPRTRFRVPGRSRQQTRERLEHLGVSRLRGPGGFDVLDGLVRAPKIALGHFGCAQKARHAIRRVGGSSGLVEPTCHALFVTPRAREQPVQVRHGCGVRVVGERRLEAGDGIVDVAGLLGASSNRAQLLGALLCALQQREAGPSPADGFAIASGRLQQTAQVAEDPQVDVARCLRSCCGPLQEENGSCRVVGGPFRDGRRLQLEARGPLGIRLDASLFIEKVDQGAGVPLPRDVPD